MGRGARFDAISAVVVVTTIVLIIFIIAAVDVPEFQIRALKTWSNRGYDYSTSAQPIRNVVVIAAQ